MSIVDILLLLACLAFAGSGYRQGFLVGALSFAGFVAGGAVGMLVAPTLLRNWQPGVGQVLAAVAIVVALATVGQVVLASIAGRLRAHLTWRPIRLLDSTAGALVSIGAVLVISWFLASALRQAPLPELSRQVGESRILAAVDSALPEQTRGLFGRFRTFLADSPFPQVFGGLSAERITPVDPPDGSVAASDAVLAARSSVVSVRGRAECNRSVEGSGFVYAPQRVITNAHVVAGVTEPVVRVGGRGRGLTARVVLYNPDRDLAVLAVPGLDATPLRFAGDAGRGDRAVVAGFPRGGPYRLDAARVRELVSARGPDIYNTRQVTREVYSLYTSIEPGNSGGPLLSPNGRVYGVIFAKSLDDPDTGYALTADEVRPIAAAGRSASAPVDTLGCAA